MNCGAPDVPRVFFFRFAVFASRATCFRHLRPAHASAVYAVRFWLRLFGVQFLVLPMLLLVWCNFPTRAIARERSAERWKP
jgi:hypothetical protein